MSDRWRRTAEIAVGLAGLGLIAVVVDGRWWWAIGRVLVVGAVVSAVMHVTDVGSGRAAGVVVTAVGLVATPVGGALVLSYRDAGWSLRLVGGVVAVSGGLAALVIGTTMIVRSMRGWRRLLAVPVGLIALYVTAFAGGMPVFATNVGRAALGRETPANRGLSYIDATLATHDGVTLSGWYIPSTTGAAVVLLHGASSTRSAVLDQAAVLARNGYGVLLFDARGMGRSGGRAMNFGWYGDRDIAAAVDYLSTRPDVDGARIGAVGESMGGEEAIGAMAADLRLRSVVAEGATNRVADDLRWLGDRYGTRGSVQQAIHKLTYGITDLLTAAKPPISLHDAVAAAERPVLLVAAGNVADEFHAANYIRSAAPARVEVWVVAGADHTGGLRTQPAEWERRVTGFLDRTLTAEPGDGAD